MTIRTSKETVTFERPFVLCGFDEVLPAGTYRVETDEELLDGISFPAYRRLSTFIYLHPKPGHAGRAQTLTIDPSELDAALKRDQASAEIPIDRDPDQRTPKGTTEPHRERSDCRAIERGEDEAMIDSSRAIDHTAARARERIVSVRSVDGRQIQ